jgi:peptidoglycan/xylan/chitin deacetylase (PgdA/CDA1 family)
MPRRHYLVILIAALAGTTSPTVAHSRTHGGARWPARQAIARPPVLRITARPAARTAASAAVIRFSAAGARRIACRLDAGRARPCLGRIRYRRLAPGRHTATVRAGNRAGTDSATVRWTVVSPPTAPVRVPILLYHVIATPGPSTPNHGLWVDPSEFSAELDWLAGKGYTAVTLQQWWDAWHGGAALPAHPIVISLDDGFDGWYWYAAPALEAHDWPAVMNLALTHLGTGATAPRNPHDTGAVWKLQPWMIERLLAAGWELDSHTLTHAHLTQISPPALAAEVGQSRATLRQRFHVPVDFFCYPYGEYDAAVIAEVAASGYLGASTTRTGIASSAGDPYQLPRITVFRGEGVAGLSRALAAAGLPH